MGVAITLADIAKRGLLGGGSGSSGGGSGGGGSSGGGAAGVSPKEVNFYDYDGTCVHAYTVAEAQALSELPAGPEHPGLVFQGWNWSLEGVKGLTRAMNIGAMYTTDDGTTRLYITLQEGRTSPMLGVGVNGTVTVDWGDGTEPDVLTGTSFMTVKWTPNHFYSKPGDYVISLTADGKIGFTGDGTSNKFADILRHSEQADVRNYAYQCALRKVEIGSNVEFVSETFRNCRLLETVTVHDGSQYTAYSFRDCRKLKTAVMPSNAKAVGIRSFNGCRSLENVSISENAKQIGEYAFSGCGSLVTVAIPDGVTSIGQTAFYENFALTSIIMPAGLGSIASSAFGSCHSMAYYDFTACTAVPTLANTNAFTGIPADCEIRVPAALYDEWIAATNWSTYADYIKAY